MDFQPSKRSDQELFGRNDANIKVIVPSIEIPVAQGSNIITKGIKAGDLVMVKITNSNSQVLKGEPLYHCHELI